VTGTSPENPTLRTARVRLVSAAILIALTVALALDLPRALPLQSAWFDALQRLSPRTLEATPVTIVAIDDRSLSQFGRWPWPSEFSDPSKASRQPRINRRSWQAPVSKSELMVWPLPVRIVSG